MLDYPLHYPGTNSTLPWTQTRMSAAVVLVALSVVMLTCCGAAALIMVACCGGRRRDTVGEGGDARWLPGVGVIDYAPASNRSSVRVSLVLPDNVDIPIPPEGDPSAHERDLEVPISSSSVPHTLLDSHSLRGEMLPNGETGTEESCSSRPYSRIARSKSLICRGKPSENHSSVSATVSSLGTAPCLSDVSSVNNCVPSNSCSLTDPSPYSQSLNAKTDAANPSRRCGHEDLSSNEPLKLRLAPREDESGSSNNSSLPLPSNETQVPVSSGTQVGPSSSNISSSLNDKSHESTVTQSSKRSDVLPVPVSNTTDKPSVEQIPTNHALPSASVPSIPRENVAATTDCAPVTGTLPVPSRPVPLAVPEDFSVLHPSPSISPRTTAVAENHTATEVPTADRKKSKFAPTAL